MNVGGQGGNAETFQDGEVIFGEIWVEQPNTLAEICADLEQSRFKLGLRVGGDQGEGFAGVNAASVLEEHLPIAGFAEGEKKAFDTRASGAAGEETGGNHLGIVNNEAVAGMEILENVTEVTVLDAAGATVQNQETRGGAVRQAVLGNEVFGKVIVKFGGLHTEKVIRQIGVGARIFPEGTGKVAVRICR